VSVRSARFARIVHVASLVILVAATVAALVGGSGDESADPFFGIVVIVVVAGYTTLGRLIVTRTGNPIGWIFLGIGAAGALGLPAEGYLLASYQTPYVASLPGSDVAGLIANAAPAAGAMAIPMLFLLFPTGAPPTRRWRWVGWLWLAGVALSSVWLVLRPGEVYGERGRLHIDNPIGLGFLEPLRFLFLDVGGLCILVSAAASIVALVVRYRRARGEERQQITWLMLVGIAALAIIATMALLPGYAREGGAGAWIESALWGGLVLVLAAGIPTATALAIFRYRLYDVDVVVSKTIVYAGLALFIGLAYVAIVVGIGALLGGDRSGDALRIAATAAVALAFQPVRERLQRFANRLVYGERATPYEVMAEFGHRMAGVLSAEDVLSDIAEAAARGVGGTAAQVTVSLPDGRERSVAWPAGNGVDTATVAMPVDHAGERIGEVAVVKAPGDPLRPAERALLDDLAGHAGPALHNVRLTADLETKAAQLAARADQISASRERLVTARDAQRRRLERELREGVGAELRDIRDEIDVDARLVLDDHAAVETSLDAIGARANAALDELRDVARGVFPSILADRGLPAALEALVRKAGASVTFVLDPAADRRYEPAVENAVYFCCVQALQNAERHAPGATAEIRLEPDGDGIRFVIRDEGPGFEISRTDAGEGMQIMQDRIAALAGELVIESTRGHGTTVTGRVPGRVMETSPA
jgi:signal transduction histidine kinase